MERLCYVMLRLSCIGHRLPCGVVLAPEVPLYSLPKMAEWRKKNKKVSIASKYKIKVYKTDR